MELKDLEEMYRKWHLPIYRFALQMTGKKETAEDIVQEAFLILIRQIEKFDAGKGPFSAFIYGIARNVILRSYKESKALDPLENTFEAKSDSDPFHDLTRAENIEKLRRAVLSLPQQYREVIVLCELHELQYEEAAAAIGCAVGTIRSRLSRARNLLLRKLSGNKEAAKTELNGGENYELQTL